MKPSNKQADNKRRDFLRGSVAATIAATVPGAALAATGDGTLASSDENYRITQHIADYYKSTL